MLAGADPCAAQDLADEIIDAAKVNLHHRFCENADRFLCTAPLFTNSFYYDFLKTNPEVKEGAREKMIQAAKAVAGVSRLFPEGPPWPS